jgi:hypothetical protein
VDKGVVFALGVEDFGERVVGGELDALHTVSGCNHGGVILGGYVEGDAHH